MNSAEREYHRFGPWLLEIKAEIDLPRQYNDKKTLILSADFIFKVPVNRDRIQMRPGMLLYDYVVSIFADRVVIFNIVNDCLKESVILFKDIQYIIQGGELLRNYIQVVTNEKSYTINYHSVSHEITSKAMSMIRKGILYSAPKINIQLVQDVKLYQLSLFKYLKSKKVIDETVKIVAYQTAKKVKLKCSEKRAKIINIFKRNKLHEILVVVNDKELIVVSSDIDHKKKETVDYSYRHIFISIEKMIDIKIRGNKIYDGVNDLTIIIGETSVSLEITEDFPSCKVRSLLDVNAAIPFY